jgi:hypothetical protein
MEGTLVPSLVRGRYAVGSVVTFHQESRGQQQGAWSALP